MIDIVTNLVRDHPCPRQESSNRGRPPVHSKDKLDFICILMVAWHKTSRDMESDLSVTNIPWRTGMTERGIRVFSILQSFAAMYSRLNLDVGESFLRVLRDPAHNIVRDGLSVLVAPPALPPHGPRAACPQSHLIQLRYNDHSMGREGQGGPHCSCCWPCRHCSCETCLNSCRRHTVGNI